MEPSSDARTTMVVGKVGAPIAVVDTERVKFLVGVTSSWWW